jgi:hypothetical protein
MDAAVREQWLDRMRVALAECVFLPASSHKRFARSIGNLTIDRLTERQRRHMIRLAWRYRRQMPVELVPSRDAVQALDAGWDSVSVAGVLVMTSSPRAKPVSRRSRSRPASAQLDLPLGDSPGRRGAARRFR